MRRTSFAEMNCPIARTLDVVGDWWTLLILRDALIWKVSRFEDFRRSLGITTSVLAERLQSACVVAARRLHLDHVGSQVAQEAGGERPGDAVAQLEHPQTVEGAGGHHGRPRGNG